jgi:hypothetical protein
MTTMHFENHDTTNSGTVPVKPGVRHRRNRRTVMSKNAELDTFGIPLTMNCNTKRGE